jgi:PAS domain S-box-containing protein
MDITKKRERRLTYVLTLIYFLLATGILAVGCFYYRSIADSNRVEVEHELSSIADLKAGELSSWRKERLGDAAIFYKNPEFSSLVRRFFSNGNDRDARTALLTWFGHFRRSYSYDAIFLLDTRYAKRLILSDDNERPVSHVSPATAEQLRLGKIVFEDFYWNDRNRKIYLKILVPILDEPGSGRLLGIVALRINPKTYLYPFIQKWPTPSRTAETQLIRRDGNEAVYLNELRFRGNTALRFRVPLRGEQERPAVQAALGREGIVTGRDYRGVPVIAAIRSVPDSPWHLVARMDSAEMNAPVREKLWLLGCLVSLLLLGTGTVLVLFWHRQKVVSHRERYAALEKVREKDQKFRALFDNVAVGVALIGPDMKVLEINKRMRELFPGFPGDETPLCYQAFRTLPQDGPCSGCPTSLTLEDGRIHEAEVESKTADGSRFFRIVSTPVTDAEGRVTAAIEMVDDITERRQAMESLRESESRLKAITDSAQDAILMMDPRGAVFFWNPAAERIFGYAKEEALGKDLHLLIAPLRYHEAHRAAFPEFLRTGSGGAVGKTLELHALRKDGTEIDVSVSLSGVLLHGAWHAVGILRDITEQKKVERALVEANLRMEEANLCLEASIERSNKMALEAQTANIAKSQFLANMSHEIRTPMNGIIGMTGLLLDTKLTKEQRVYAEVVRSSGETLLRVINDILDFSKIEADRLELEILDFDLRVTIEDTAELLALRAHEKKLDFVCRIKPGTYTFLRGDPGRLRQILTNLGGNAIKFTSRGEVVIDVFPLEETHDRLTLRFEVRDSGLGIPADKQELIFNEFEQVDASTTRRFGGTGLGLAISKRLVELMGGTIGVESIEECGSKFWFTIEFEKQPLDILREEPRQAEIRGVRVLIVDDNATNRLVLAEQLASWGVRHEETEDAITALDMLRAARKEGDPFRILITDMQMPDMDGEHLGAAVKSDPEVRDTLMIMLTSLGRRGDARRYRKLGFSAYLTKPVKQSQMYDCLATVLGNATHHDRGQPKPLVTRHTISEAQRLRVRILLADDNATNRQVALGILGKMGYRADAAADGWEAIQALETVPYDVVLMDVQMPVMDGFEATRAIRSGQTKALNPRIPIIAMTAHALKGDRERCLENGMDDYLPKPINPSDLSAILNKWLTGAEGSAWTAEAATTETVPEPASAVFDRQALLTRLIGDEALAKEILSEFLEDMPQQLADLREQIASAHSEQAGIRGHTIKSAAANIGGMAFSAVAFQIEKACKSGDSGAMPALLLELEHQYELLRECIREVLA